MKNAMWAMLRNDSPTGLVVRIAADLIIGTVLGRASFLHWREKYRQERRVQRRIRDEEHEEEVELLKSEVGMLNSRLGQAESARDTLIDGVKQAVAFDRECVVTPSEGGRYIFVFAGCESVPGKDEFLGCYVCPTCSGRLEVPEKKDSDGIFLEHLATCPGLRRSMSAT